MTRTMTKKQYDKVYKQYLIYNAGYSAWILNKPVTDNPYPVNTEQFDLWAKGWNNSKYDYIQAYKKG